MLDVSQVEDAHFCTAKPQDNPDPKILPKWTGVIFAMPLVTKRSSIMPLGA